MNFHPDTYARQIEILNGEMDLVIQKQRWAVVLGLRPQLDGDHYCFLWGDDLQSGIAGFGRTVAEALADFDQAMNRPAPAHGDNHSE